MSADPPRILVADDDPDIVALLDELFVDAGYAVARAATGREALRALYAFQPDVVLLDITMPELDGWRALERIRDMSDVPVIMVTARAADADKVRGLRGGADDYVTKPFALDELLARVDAVLRRSRLGHKQAVERYGDDHLDVDFAEGTVRVDGTAVTLTPLEFKLLAAFVRRPNEVLTRERLLELAWRGQRTASADQVTLYVAYLRRKLEAARRSDLPAIETVRGRGYRYRTS